MKYLCLIYYDEEVLEKLGEPESNQLREECSACSEGLTRSGHQLMAGVLASVKNSRALKGAERMVTDGPFAETKEHLGGFSLIEARDLNEAIQLVSRMPPARFGSIEIRPVRQLAPA